VIKLRCKVPNARRVANRLRSAGRKAPVFVKRILEWGGDLVAEKAKANLAKEAKSGTGLTAQGIWASKAKGRFSNEMRVETGWSHKHGAVLEWGPERATGGWEIRAKTGKFLRIPITASAKGFFSQRRFTKSGRVSARKRKLPKGMVDQVIYRRRVWHPWDDSMRRPHFEDAVNQVWPKVIAKMPEAIKEAIDK
jgi:hypothetical protein